MARWCTAAEVLEAESLAARVRGPPLLFGRKTCKAGRDERSRGVSATTAAMTPDNVGSGIIEVQDLGKVFRTSIRRAGSDAGLLVRGALLARSNALAV